MNEPFDAIEDIVRRLGEDVRPAVSLRQRILAASHLARERQLNRHRTLLASGWFSVCLCVIYAGLQVQQISFTTLVGRAGSELSVAINPAANGSLGLLVGEQSAIASHAEVVPSAFGDRVEWETAESHLARRTWQSTVISHYF